MSRCRRYEMWSSFINDQPDDVFVIERIDGQGNFNGTHGHDTIQGQCGNGRITFHRRQYLYDGWYSGNEKVIGKRYLIHLTKDRLKLTDDDVWVGTHTTLMERDAS